MQLKAYPTSVLKREYIGQESCSVARTFEIIGDRWTWLLIRDAFLGCRSSRRFERASASPRTCFRTVWHGSSKEGIFERVCIASAQHGSNTD